MVKKLCRACYEDVVWNGRQVIDGTKRRALLVITTMRNNIKYIAHCGDFVLILGIFANLFLLRVDDELWWYSHF